MINKNFVNLIIHKLIFLTLFDFNNFESVHQKDYNIVYILEWTWNVLEPLCYWKRGRKHFVMMDCEFQNCFITNKNDYFDDITNFDVLLFNSVDTSPVMSFPWARSANQIYIFVSTESAHNRPLTWHFNDFFNYTMTYKLNSDVVYPYFYVRNNRGEIVAPAANPQWLDTKDMLPVNETIIEKLQTKKTAAAWFVTNCFANSHRLGYIYNLRGELNKYNHTVDIYGPCGREQMCPKEEMDECMEKIETDYYFYLAFENSFSEDYITEKVLLGFDHFAVPVVLGGADYKRFMPNGTYLSANVMDEATLAAKMVEIIQNKTQYYEFFKWHNHYSFHGVSQSTDTEPLCALCALLNNMERRSERRVYHRFTQWWSLYDDTKGVDAVTMLGHDDPHMKGYFSYSKPREPPPREEPTVSQKVSTFFELLMNYIEKP